MSGVIEGQAPQVADDFDAQWQSARAGDLPAPAQEPQAPVASGEGQGAESVQTSAAAPVQTPTEEQFDLPAPLQEKIRAAGAKDLDELIANARGYHSLKGNLPQMEQQWREKYVAPVEGELAKLREERRQAIEEFVRIDPTSNRVRSPQEQAQVRQALETQERETQAAENQSQERAQFELEKQSLAQAKEGLLRQGMEASIAPYLTNLAKEHKVPVDVLRDYVRQARVIERVRDLPDPKMFRHIIVELGQYAEESAPKVAAQRAAEAAPKYRDVGAGAGVGGSQSGHRWDTVADAEFDQAWESSKAGNLR